MILLEIGGLETCFETGVFDDADENGNPYSEARKLESDFIETVDFCETLDFLEIEFSLQRKSPTIEPCIVVDRDCGKICSDASETGFS